MLGSNSLRVVCGALARLARDGGQAELEALELGGSNSLQVARRPRLHLVENASGYFRQASYQSAYRHSGCQYG